MLYTYKNDTQYVDILDVYKKSPDFQAYHDARFSGEPKTKAQAGIDQQDTGGKS